ncbi:hypothetical protein VOLCADRAFT_87345 [Volvox carteri f. nagariensis]|uniref:Uncharacterized protein n=1 Tax=Volvox carteri f. nagariensis TaxID=3068 RepID=D8TL38_VOLCA|nr:uncharacterized protein VOLCADRAFT_87345 [Volvox carteri f. nagariensis]EFJ51670.1 hypothetical protein VOLCADRAFT_87345 [Volvox carteri f. nagariensis]|eukprot:XP_002947080.1 hypothetical protein VOLCADRAFT_87345 [Volvox carteri f. nagariensis]
MGAGASAAHRTPPEPTAADVAALEQPYYRGAREACYYCLPYDDDVKREIEGHRMRVCMCICMYRSPVVVLEVGPLGFRLLRPNSKDCLFAYPWGQIHSWTHLENRFSFRYFDDGKKKVVQYVLYLRDLPDLLGHIQIVIDSILAERKSLAIPADRFADLLGELEALPSSPAPAFTSPGELLSSHYTAEFYFWSDQGRQLIDAIPSSFDKLEAAVLLHGRLIDQNRFSFVLEGLESQADRDNVWHRISVQKKKPALGSAKNSLVVSSFGD